MKKKIVSILLVSSMVAAVTACGAKSEAPATVEATEEATEEVVEEEAEAAEEVVEEEATEETTEEVADADVMSYADFVAAAVDDPVTVITYVQANQSWWDNTVTMYTQDKDGGYFLYGAACDEATAELLVPGTKIKATGYKAEWSGEVEIADATFEIIDDGDTYVADPVDITAAFGTDDLEGYMNQKIAVAGLTVEASKDADGNEAAFLYNWDGSGSQGDDLYFNVSVNGETYSFTVESYLTGADTDVYKAVEALNVGDTIDIEGFLYWYEGAQPHVTSVTVK